MKTMVFAEKGYKIVVNFFLGEEIETDCVTLTKNDSNSIFKACDGKNLGLHFYKY